MKIGFLTNDVATEKPGYTTVRLALAAHQRGHESYYLSVGELSYEPDGSISARARRGAAKTYRSRERYLEDLQDEAQASVVNVSEFDVVMLRSDPADDAGERAWANNAGIAFGRLLAEQGVLVLNEPSTLSLALSKAYFQHFPEIVRPKTLISRDEQRITEFIDELGGKAVIKPLQGSGGSGVFLVDKKQAPNLNQIVEAVARDGYVVTQEYLPAAADGDVRMFLMNGRPIEVDGKFAAFRRRNETEDMRSNVSAGGKVVGEEVTDEMLELASIVRPKLLADGLFLVGLDIVGDKLMEVNVFSPGGLGVSESLYGGDFAGAVIDELERKAGLREHYGLSLPNIQLATM